MIAYIRGRLEYVDQEEGMAVLETGGIGYQINGAAFFLFGDFALGGNLLHVRPSA